jgi:hypothetical protein
MYYTVYKITNKINNKIYVGVHKTKDLNDGYMGSGKILKNAVEKYGIDNFVKEYIAIFDNASDMFNMESQIVNEQFVLDSKTYNLKTGGFGGFDYINKNKLTSYPGRLEKDLEKLKLAKKKRQELIHDTEWNKNFKERVSNGLKNYFKYNTGHFKGKSHSEETKQKLSGPRPQSEGKNNSQFGTMWITNRQENKKIKKDDLIPEGWYKGRT